MDPELIKNMECALRYPFYRLGFSKHVVDEHIAEIRVNPHIVLDCIPGGATPPATQFPVAHLRQVMERPSSVTPRVHFAFLMSKLEKDRADARLRALEAQLEEANQDMQEKDQQIAALNAQLEAANTLHANHQDRVARATQDKKEKDEQLKQEVGELRMAARQAECEWEGLLQKLDQRLAALATRLDTSEAQLGSAKHSLQQHQRRARQAAQKHKKERMACKVVLTLQRQRIRRLESDVRAAHDEVAVAHDEAADAAGDSRHKRRRTRSAAGRVDKGKRRAVTPNTATGEGSASATATRRGQRVPAGALKIRSEEGGRWRKATAVQFAQKGDDQRRRSGLGASEAHAIELSSDEESATLSEDNDRYCQAGLGIPPSMSTLKRRHDTRTRRALINAQLTRTNGPLTTGRLILRCQALEDDTITWKPVAVYEHLPTTKGEVELHFSKAEFEGLSGGYTLALREPGDYRKPGDYVLRDDKGKEIQMRDIVLVDYVPGFLIDVDEMAREALINLLKPHKAVGGAAWLDTWALPERCYAEALEASHTVWPGGIPAGVEQCAAWQQAADSVAADMAEEEEGDDDNKREAEGKTGGEGIDALSSKSGSDGGTGGAMTRPVRARHQVLARWLCYAVAARASSPRNWVAKLVDRSLRDSSAHVPNREQATTDWCELYDNDKYLTGPAFNASSLSSTGVFVKSGVCKKPATGSMRAGGWSALSSA
eukprot:g3008.t1